MAVNNVINNSSYSLTIDTTITTTNGDASVGNTDVATTAPFISFKKSRSGGTITSGDLLGIIDFQGYAPTSGYVVSSKITSTSSGTIANNRVASDLKFYTHPDSTTASTLRMTIASTGEVTIAAPDSGTGLTVTAGGITCSSGDVTASSGDFAISSGNLTLPTTTSSVGQITIGGTCHFHAYGTSNIFVGAGAGNFTTSGNGGHVGIGYGALTSMGSSEGNTACGYNAGTAITTGSFNTLCGDRAGNTFTTGSYNCCFGYLAGASLTTSDSSNILLGWAQGSAGLNNTLIIGKATGTGIGELNKAYIYGVYGKSVGATAQVALIDSTSVVGGLAGSSGEVLMGGTKPAFSASPTLTTVTATNLYGTNIYTNVAAAQLKLSGTTIAADGSNTDIDVTITPKGTGGLKSLPVYSYAVGATNRAMLVDNAGYIGNATSSRRFKENINDMGDRSNFLNDLRPVTFNYKSDDQKREKFGLIAEEVAEVCPSLVSFDEQGLPYTVSYHELPVLLLNELQKTIKRIDVLEEKLDITNKG